MRRRRGHGRHTEEKPIRTALAAILAAAAPGAAAAEVADTAAAIVEKTNALRKAQGLQPVERNTALEDAARGFARFMENLAYEYRSTGYESAESLAREFVEGWKQSPEHRKNMLEPAATETGVGVAQGEEGRYFAVQMFGRPKSAAIRFSVENRASRPVEYTAGGRSYTLAPRVTRTHMVCRRMQLEIQVPGKKKPFAAQARDGAHYTVTDDGVS